MKNTAMQQNLKWEQRQRLTLLEATVFWSGELSTGALLQHFGISRVQASKDLTLYQSLYPENIRYDRNLKRYVITDTFKAGFMQGTAREFLRILQIPPGDGAGALVALADNLPSVELLEPAFRQVKQNVLQKINQAIVTRKQVLVSYQSMSRPETAELRLCPHTLVYDGLRWHARCYSHTHQQYRDFVLARMQTASLGDAAEQEADADVLWQTVISIKIGPHPGLSSTQKTAVEFDYGMVNGVLEQKVRAALTPYFLRGMRIGSDDMQRKAMEQQIVLLNRAEIQAYCAF
jgi:predicted DNA-binding transcriptional regulator YafY